MNTNIYLTPQQIAEQFGFYADSAEKEANRLKEGSGIAAVFGEANEREKVHQLRFCANFIREHGFLRWSKYLPTKPGYYLIKFPHETDVMAVHVVEGRAGCLRAGNSDNGYYELEIEGETTHVWRDAQWAGPIVIEEET